MTQPYQSGGPSRAEVDALQGLTVLEFGNDWCGYCQAAQPLVQQALTNPPMALRHLKVADGPGLPLGRSFRIKLWPTLVFLRDGQEHARVTRPQNVGVIQQALSDTVKAAG